MINEGNISGVRCPDAGCIQENARISDDDILDVVGPELYERYHKLFIKQKLEADPSVVWCPRRQCQGPAFKDGTHTTLAICQQCKLAFCTLCRKTWHGTEFCSIDNLQRLIEEYESADDARKKQLEAQYGAKNFMRIIQEATQEHQSITWIKEHTTECPTCGAHIEKTIGCNHMQCSTCNTHFCYLCGAYLSSTQPLKHFNIPGMPCYQRLFENLGANPEELVQLALAENN
jgi:E3 ubiquitin-protein ligase RNF14